MNQRERIYNYMKEHGSITSLECSDKLRITKLTTRLSEMRREGIKIASREENSKEGKYNVYWLEEE